MLGGETLLVYELLGPPVAQRAEKTPVGTQDTLEAFFGLPGFATDLALPLLRRRKLSSSRSTSASRCPARDQAPQSDFRRPGFLA